MSPHDGDQLPIAVFLARMRCELAATAVMVALTRLQHLYARKAGFDPSQPRDDHGRWTDGSGNALPGGDDRRTLSDADPDEFWRPGTQLAAGPRRPVGLGHNRPPPDQSPRIPEQPPASLGERISLARAVAEWTATGAAIMLTGWALIELWPMVQSNLDPPRSFEDLQRSHLPSEKGYHDHHIVEQGPALREGFPRSRIDGRDNVVRIPQFKHYEITNWYSTRNDDFGGLSPRDYLRGKGWREREVVGRAVLIKNKVLKP
jgi:hypothetical protein